MGSKKLQVWLPVLFALVMILGMIIGFKLREDVRGVSSFLKLSKKSSIQEVLDLVDARYVDDIGDDSLTLTAIEQILEKLDPHSVYIPSDKLKYANEDLEGGFDGIGVEFQLFYDTVNITNVLKGGPSEKAGLLVGDKIVKVNDSINLVKKEFNKIRNSLRGPKGSNVKVTVVRNAQLKDVTITRGTIPLPAVSTAYMIAPKVGFIHIDKFSETTYEEFMQSLEKLQKSGMDKLIVDLRGNGGGYMNEATQIADEFLEDDKLIVYTQGEHVKKQEYRAKREGLFEKGKLIILIDETSASASEVLAGALQDWDRATILGRRSFGKGLVQEQYQLSDGAALRLTVARYFTPLGRNIQKPYSQGRAKYEEELMERYNNGEVMHGDTAKHNSKPFKTPGGRTVYGGGGITPDVFVGADSSNIDKNVVALYRKGILSNFIYTYYVSNINTFKSYKDPVSFSNQYSFGETHWSHLKTFAAKDSISLDAVSAKDKAETLERMEVMMARQIWRNEGYYQVNNQTDKAIKKALEILK
jgi:carboxyl-terminal processing protease